MTTTVLDIAPSGAALGATVQGLDLHQPLDEAHIGAIYTALVEHQVLIFPQQSLPADDQISFAAAFGLLQVHAALDALADHPEVVVFDTHERATTAEWWHSDVTCAPKPPLGSILQIVIAPPTGGATHWASMTAAYDALDVDTQRKLEGLTALHRSWWQPVQEAVHPVVRVHPDSGRKGIFVNGIFTNDEAVFDDNYAPSFVHHSKVIHDVDRGGEGEKQSMRRFRDAIPDGRFEVIDLVVGGDRAAVRLRIQGTARAAFGTVPAGPVDIHAVAWFRVEVGELGLQVAEEWLFTDAASP